MILESLNKEDRYAEMVRGYFGSNLEYALSPTTRIEKIDQNQPK